jgi:hypothetical protein
VRNTYSATPFMQMTGGAGVEEAAARVESAHAGLGEAWSREQLPYYARTFDVMLCSTRAWLLWSQGKRADAVAAMQSAADYAEGGFGPEIGQVWHPFEMMAEMYMQLNQPAPALVVLNQFMKLYPNRFNSIAAAAAASVALQSSSSSLSPAAASYYAQILALSSSAQELQSASSSVPGERCHQLSRLIIDVLLFKESIRSSVCAWRVLLHLDPQVGAQLLPSTVFGL